MCGKATLLVRQPWLQPLRFLFFAFTKLLKKALTLEDIRTPVCRVCPALFVPPLFRSARKLARRSLDSHRVSSTALSSSSFRLGKSGLRLFRRDHPSGAVLPAFWFVAIERSKSKNSNLFVWLRIRKSDIALLLVKCTKVARKNISWIG
jgi:hypothetical protein